MVFIAALFIKAPERMAVVNCLDESQWLYENSDTNATVYGSTYLALGHNRHQLEPGA